MRLRIVFCLVVLGAISCSKKVTPAPEPVPVKSERKKAPNALNELKRSGVENVQAVRKERGPRKPKYQSLEELNRILDLKGSVVLSHFRPGSDAPVLTINDELCRDLVNQINQLDGGAYELVGHTNSQGNAQSNLVLSSNRAQNTLDGLVNDYSLDLSKVTTIGEGETNPIADNTTSKGRRQNSRVELRKRY